MFLLGAIVVIGMIFIFYRIGLSTGSVIGGLLGLFIGSSLGLAGGGTAINAAWIFAGIGFIIGGLSSKPKGGNKVAAKSFAPTINGHSTDTFYNLPPEVEQLIKQEKEFELAQLLVYLEMKGDGDIARKTMRIIRSANSDLGHRVKQIRDNLRVKNNLK